MQVLPETGDTIYGTEHTNRVPATPATTSDSERNFARCTEAILHHVAEIGTVQKRRHTDGLQGERGANRALGTAVHDRSR